VESKYSPEEIITAIKAIAPYKEDKIMTAAQHLRQEGRHTTSLEIAKAMLSKLHLDIKSVKEVTGLSEAELMELQEEAQR